MPKTQGRPVAEITLSDPERQKLQMMAARPKSSQRDAGRARIILRCADGLTHTEVARREKVSLPTVGKWRACFASERGEAQRRRASPRRAPPHQR